MVQILPAAQETQVWSLSWEDPLEKGMATHSSSTPAPVPLPGQSRGQRILAVNSACGHRESDCVTDTSCFTSKSCKSEETRRISQYRKRPLVA